MGSAFGPSTSVFVYTLSTIMLHIILCILLNHFPTNKFAVFCYLLMKYIPGTVHVKDSGTAYQYQHLIRCKCLVILGTSSFDFWRITSQRHNAHGLTCPRSGSPFGTVGDYLSWDLIQLYPHGRNVKWLKASSRALSSSCGIGRCRGCTCNWRNA